MSKDTCIGGPDGSAQWTVHSHTSSEERSFCRHSLSCFFLSPNVGFFSLVFQQHTYNPCRAQPFFSYSKKKKCFGLYLGQVLGKRGWWCVDEEMRSIDRQLSLWTALSCKQTLTVQPCRTSKNICECHSPSVATSVAAHSHQLSWVVYVFSVFLKNHLSGG